MKRISSTYRDALTTGTHDLIRLGAKFQKGITIIEVRTQQTTATAERVNVTVDGQEKHSVGLVDQLTTYTINEDYGPGTDVLIQAVITGQRSDDVFVSVMFDDHE